MNDASSPMFRSKRFSRWFLIGVPAAGIGLFWLVYHHAPLLFTGLMIAWGCYYLLSPIVDFLEGCSIRRGFACLLLLVGIGMCTYFLWLGFLSYRVEIWNQFDLDRFRTTLRQRVEEAVLWTGNRLPPLKKYMESLNQTATAAEEKLVSKIPTRPSQFSGKKKSQAEPVSPPAAETPVVAASPEKQALPSQINDMAEQQIREYAPQIAYKILGFIPILVLVPFFTFFFLKDGRAFKKTIIQWIPNKYFEPSLKFFYEMDHRIRSYLLGLLLDCTLVGILVAVGCAIVGTPFPILLGVIAFSLNSIPLLGPLLYGTIGLVLTIGQGASAEIILGYVGVILLSRLCDDLLFIPAILGKSNHLHPVAVLCAVLLGESLAGVWGMLLAIPIVSIMLLALTIAREISVGEDVDPLPSSTSAPFA